MNKKLLWGLTAMLFLTATACQNTGKATSSTSTPAAQPANSAANNVTNGASNNSESSSIPTPTTQPTKSPESNNAQPAAAQVSPSPQPAKKLYKLNPKSYDIVPIDPNPTEKKMVLLTFDDGPKDHDMLESMLKTLDKHQAKAIFFVNGYRVKQKPELLKLILEHGQTIGNHSWDHIDLKKENKEKVEQQIGDVQKLVKEVTGFTPQFFRPPFGSGSDVVRAKVKEENMLFMTWSNGSLDWEMTTKNNNPDKIISNVMEQLRPGSNILMHELPWTEKTLDNLLTELKAKQYGFVDPATIEITP
jgi:peptidoglycan/xylan/chitin deacetylase (PgdA/CDA1 family)